ncbi:MAG: alpha/beta hydrolase [Verrucomicrobiota bacterium]
MKYERLVWVMTFGISSLMASEPIWDEGDVPFQKEIDQSTGSPCVTPYLTKGGSLHTGAAVVICPGGGYGGLAKDHEGHQPAEWFRDQGVSAFVLQYRLGSEGHHYPTQLADIQRAIRWVRGHGEEFAIDPDRIAVMGFSAGGHLASMAATLYDEEVYEASDEIDAFSARPDYAILCYPVISLNRSVGHGGSRNRLLGPDRKDDESLAAKLSSDLNVKSSTPPTFLFQTDEDPSVSAENALSFYLALRREEVPAELHVYQKGVHGVGLFRGDPVLRTWSELLEHWLKTNFFFAKSPGSATIEGEVSLDGQPVSWGVLSFEPEDDQLPAISIRVRRGRFSASEEMGPLLGRCQLFFEGSIWEATGSEEDSVVQLDSFEPGGKPIELEITSGMAPLEFDFRSR